jgi:hypothetical protein
VGNRGAIGFNPLEGLRGISTTKKEPERSKKEIVSIP